jgi:hypothetical protein
MIRLIYSRMRAMKNGHETSTKLRNSVIKLIYNNYDESKYEKK